MATSLLRILETTDLHMNLTGFDYVTGETSAQRGLAQLAPVISAARAEVDQTLLFDNGDFLQGTPLADHIAQQGDDTTHPMIAAFNALDYDAITLGNHEFDYGLPLLTRALDDAAMPVVCANLRTGPRDDLYAPWTVLTRDLPCSDGQSHPLRVGIIGFAPPQTVGWGAHHLQGTLMSDDIVAAARTHVPQLKRAGADIIVALCHAGIATDPATDRMENAALPLAALPDIDVVLTGHIHDVFPGGGVGQHPAIDHQRSTLHGKPAVMAGAHGAALGVIDLTLERDQGGWRISDHAVAIRRPDASPSTDPIGQHIIASVTKAHAATCAQLRKPVSTTPRRLTSYFAAIGRDDSAALLADAQISEVTDALRTTRYADLPVLAATSSFRAGGHNGPGNYLDLPPGPLTRGDVTAIAPFDNPVCAVLRRGWQIRDWLERSSAFFGTINPGDPAPDLIRNGAVIYHFDTLHGLRYRIDLRVPPQPGAHAPRRVRDVTHDGQPLQDDALFVVATSSYRAFGGGDLIHATPEDVVHTSQTGIANVLANYLATTPIPATAQPAPWQFVPATGAALSFRSAPTAAHLIDAADHGLTLRAGQRRSDGFQDFTLHL